MNKIADLLERMERVKSVQTDDTPDALSVSLWELGAELAEMNDDGITAAAEEWGITPDDVREMVRTYAR